MEQKRSIEFLRFAFCILIIILHFRGYGTENAFSGGYLGVDIFFVLSGFFLMQKFCNSSHLDSPEKDAFLYLKGRVKKYFPHHLFSWICVFIVSVFITESIKCSTALGQAIWELLFLKCTGLGRNVSINGVSWYLSSLLMSSFLIWFLLSSNKARYTYIIAPIVFFAVMGLFYNKKGYLDLWTQQSLVLTDGFWRGFSEMGLGVISYELYSSLKSRVRITKYHQISATIIEIIGWGFVLYYCYYGFGLKDFLIPVLASGLLISMCLFNSFFTKILDNPISEFLGRISFPMYLNQMIFINLFKAFFPGRPFWPMTGILILLIFSFSLFSDWFVKKVSSMIRTVKISAV